MIDRKSLRERHRVDVNYLERRIAEATSNIDNNTGALVIPSALSVFVVIVVLTSSSWTGTLFWQCQPVDAHWAVRVPYEFSGAASVIFLVLVYPLVRQMNVFARWLTVLILLIAAMLLVFGYFVGHLEFSEMFMAVGVQVMARRNAIVRRLPAIETLGIRGTVTNGTYLAPDIAPGVIANGVKQSRAGTVESVRTVPHGVREMSTGQKCRRTPCHGRTRMQTVPALDRHVACRLLAMTNSRVAALQRLKVSAIRDSNRNSPVAAPLPLSAKAGIG